MKKAQRLGKHKKVRKVIFGTSERPRVCVFRSTQHIYAQIIDDSKGTTLVAASDIKLKGGIKLEKAKNVGTELAKAALAKKIKKIVFDRGGFKYQGRVAALAQGLRDGGLDF